MGSGNTCNCGSIKRRHLDYECSLKAIDPIMYPDGWNSILQRKDTMQLTESKCPTCWFTPSMVKSAGCLPFDSMGNSCPDKFHDKVISNVDRVEIKGTTINIITKTDVPNPSIGPTCRVTNEGEHGMATINPPFLRPEKEIVDIAAPLVR